MSDWLDPKAVCRMVTPTGAWCLCMRIPPRSGISVVDLSALDLSNQTRRRELVLILAAPEHPVDREGRAMPAEDYRPGTICCMRGFLRYGQEVGKLLSDSPTRNRADDLSMVHLTDLDCSVSWRAGDAGAEAAVFGADQDYDDAHVECAALYGACVLRAIEQTGLAQGKALLDPAQIHYLQAVEDLHADLRGRPGVLGSGLQTALQLYEDMR